MTRRPLEPGDRVSVPWGLDVVSGVVVQVRGGGPSRRIVVSVDLGDLEDDQNPQLITFPEEALEEATQLAADRKPGAWASAYRYEQDVLNILSSLLRHWDIDPDRHLHISSHDHAYDVGPDFTLNLGDRVLLIEAKASTSGKLSRETIDRLWDHARTLHPIIAFLVTNGDLDSSALRRLQDIAQNGPEIKVVKWRSSQDNEALSNAIREVLEAA